MSMFKLLAVTDQASCPENFWTQLQLLAASEIDALIFRAKELPPQEYYRQASQVQKICRTHQLPLILHTYQQLLCQPQLRAQVQCLGVSIHHADEAVRAADLGADYLLAGHIFATSCKQGLPGRGLDFLSAVCAATSLPVYAIGGITPANIGQIKKTGAAGACLMSSLMTCPEPAVLVQKLRQALL